MKDISAGLDNHLNQTVTTLATAWRIEREDGIIRGFTDHDKDIVIDGLTYYASSGYFRTAISNSAGPSVDNVDVRGFLDSSHIDEAELRNGKYDYASVQIFAYNWADVSMGIIPLRFGIFGETVITSSGVFKIELRGLTQLLSQTVGEVYQPECRADLGDGRCKIKLLPEVRKSGTAYSVGDRVLISNQPIYNYTVPIDNPDFESGATGWNYLGDTWGVYFNIRPKSGNKMATLGDSYSNDIYQEVPLQKLGLTEAQIDSGQYYIELTSYMRVADVGIKSRLFCTMYNGGNNTISNLDTGMTTVIKGAWQEFTIRGKLIGGTRKLRISIELEANTYLRNVPLLVDSVNLRVFDPVGEPLTSSSFINFGGVEYECTTSGVTANTSPVNINRNLNSNTNDGTVVWKTVSPRYTFLDTIATVSNGKSFTLNNNSMPNGFFEWGVLELLQGQNKGKRIEVHSWDAASKRVVLKLPLPYVPAIGERVRIQAGCNKDRSICQTKFHNILNFRGEPDLPGTDQYFKVGGANTQGEI